MSTSHHADHPCRICGASALHEFEEFRSLPRVTSDSRPWAAGGRLTVCTSCGTTQKADDAKWRAEIDEIYGTYAIYHQSEGAEQPIFCDHEGELLPRSAHIASYLEERIGLPVSYT